MKTLLLSLLVLLAGCVTPATVRVDDPAPVTYSSRFGTVRLTEGGPQPALVVLDGQAGGVAFVNDTRDEVYAIRFVGPALPDADSAYARDFRTVGRVTFTPSPLRPGEGASVYLYGPGTYAFEVCESGRSAYRGQLRLELPER